MAKCDCCGRESGMPFDCPYCGGSFCSDHRLPPSHRCPNEEQWRNRHAAPGTVQTENAGPSVPRSPCAFPGCDAETSRVFYCPACGQDFCEEHRLHRDHASGSGNPAGHTEPAGPAPAAPPPKVPIGRYGIALILIALVIIGGGVVIAGKLLQAGSGATDVPPAPAYVTTVAASTPPTAPPTTVQTAVQTTVPQLVPEIITVAPTATTRTTAPVTKAPASATVTPSSRPATGTIVAGTALYGGMGKMTIDNTGGSSDVVSVLTRQNSRKTLIGIYVRQGTSTTISRISDGSYDFYVHGGQNWNAGTKRFLNGTVYWKFEDPVVFTSTQIRPGSTQHTSWTVKIYPSVTGNAESEPVAAGDFPGL